MQAARLQRTVVSSSLVVIALALSGCGLLRTATQAPGQLANAVMKPGESPMRLSHKDLRARLMRFSDICTTELSRATREFAQSADSQDANEQALTWRIEYSDTYWRLASGQQPYSAMLDMLVVTSALRLNHEQQGLAKWGEADRPMYDAFVRLESRAWEIAAESLHQATLDDVKKVIEGWLAGGAAVGAADVSRMPSFESLLADKKDGESGLSTLFSIDPLSGLEPAVREMEQVRELSERALFYLQRVPTLLAARAELLLDRSLRQPQVTGTLASLDRVSLAAASVAATAEALPAQFTAEREATLAQISQELSAQRAGLVSDLEKTHGPMVELLDTTRKTAEAGRDMSASLSDAIRAFDTLMGRFQRPKDAKPEPAAEPATPAHPFDIREYTAAAEQITLASRELGQAITALDATAPGLQKVLDEAAARGDRTIDHAFTRGLEILLAALVGGALTTLAVRRVSWRWRS